MSDYGLSVVGKIGSDSVFRGDAKWRAPEPEYSIKSDVVTSTCSLY